MYLCIFYILFEPSFRSFSLVSSVFLASSPLVSSVFLAVVSTGRDQFRSIQTNQQELADKLQGLNADVEAVSSPLVSSVISIFPTRFECNFNLSHSFRVWLR